MKVIIAILMLCWVSLTLIFIAQLNELSTQEERTKMKVKEIERNNRDLTDKINKTIYNRKIDR